MGSTGWGQDEMGGKVSRSMGVEERPEEAAPHGQKGQEKSDQAPAREKTVRIGMAARPAAALRLSLLTSHGTNVG